MQFFGFCLILMLKTHLLFAKTIPKYFSIGLILLEFLLSTCFILFYKIEKLDDGNVDVCEKIFIIIFLEYSKLVPLNVMYFWTDLSILI